MANVTSTEQLAEMMLVKKQRPKLLSPYKKMRNTNYLLDSLMVISEQCWTHSLRLNITDASKKVSKLMGNQDRLTMKM